MIVGFMITCSVVTVAAKSKVYRSSNHLDSDYVQLTTTDNGMIRVEGRTVVGKERFALVLAGPEALDILFTGAVRRDGSYGREYDASSIRSGKFNELRIAFSQGTDIYRSYYTRIRLDHEAGELWFAPSPVYEQNLEIYSSYSPPGPSEYLEVKLLAIHDWVAQNIYYNWDGYLSGEYGRTDAYGTLKNKTSVCHGYAVLTETLLRNAGIPARVVTGHALGASADGKYWDDVDHSKTNHAWNEAFVDGRWVMIDVTWDSGDKYKNGQFHQGEMDYCYFDPSLEAFSHTHKMMP